MFEQKIADVTYEFNCKLGTTIKIKTKFNKPFMQLIQELDKLDVPDVIKLLHCGIDEKTVSYDDFSKNILDNIGLMELYEIVQLFVKKIQYPSLTAEEIDLKLKEKNAQTETGK